MTPEERSQLAIDSTFRRIVELELDPVVGNFDSDHLKEINRRIFQDLPELGYREMRPGQFREQVPDGQDWVKNRVLATVDGIFCVAYSRMDSEALDRLDDMLDQLSIEELSALDIEQFSNSLAELYAELDYVHPFSDGNSRTLRSFTGQLAGAAGYDIDWGRFNQSPLDRDLLYVARDLDVIELALPSIQNQKTLQEVIQTADRLSGNRDLSCLFNEAIRPCRAFAFETLSETDALTQYPELLSAYQELHEARNYFIREGSQDTEEMRERAVDAVAAQIQKQLDQGKTDDFIVDLEVNEIYRNLTPVQEIRQRR